MIQRAWNSDKPSAPNNGDPLPPPPPLLMASGHSFCSCGDSFLSAQTEPVFSKRHWQMVTIPPLPVCHTNTIYACGLPSSVVCFRRRLLVSLDFVVDVFLSSLFYDFLFISSQRHNFIPIQTHFITANLLVGGGPQREKCLQSIS